METEEQKRKKGLELLFGESDDEEALEPLNQLDPFLVASDEEEDVPLPSFKLSKSGNPVKRRKKEQPTDLEEGTIDPEQLKKSEVQRDIDDALSRINNRVQTNDLDEAQLDEIMIRIVTEMKQTAQEDQELNKQKLPAINKLKYLSVVNVYFEKLNRYCLINLGLLLQNNSLIIICLKDF